jgi:pyruvate dehydrogenase E2 component (dihydrolipoamide acetyltransferase)
MSIETDKFDALYKRLKPHGVTMTALLAKAVGAALASHPVLFAGALIVSSRAVAWAKS